MKYLNENYQNFLVVEFQSKVELHNWLLENESRSKGIWVRVYKTKSKIQTVTFQEILEEGLCFGWSESMRQTYDDVSYLQKITPRKGSHTQSQRNLNLVEKLERENRMGQSGYQALGLKKEKDCFK